MSHHSLLSLMRGHGRRGGLFVLAARVGSDGFPAAVDHEIRTSLAEDRMTVAILLDFDPDRAELMSSMPPGVAVRRFWRDATPGAGGYACQERSRQPDDVPVPTTTGWCSGRYNAGRPVLVRSESGYERRVTPWGAPLHRDEVDVDGVIVRVVDLDPETGREVTHRYLGSNGRCWLSVWLEPPTATPGRTLQYLPKPREFPTLRAAQALWVRRLNSAAPRSTLVAVDPDAREVARLADVRWASPTL